MPERRLGLSPGMMRWAVIVALVLLLEVIGQMRLVSRTVFVPPSAMVGMLWTLIQTGAVWPHLGRTVFEVLAAFGLACGLGIPLGVLLWRLPYLSRITEPYLTSLYALPLVFFYPILLALLGLGPPPIIVIATTMATVPIVVNTRIGFAEVRDIYLRLGRSVGCSSRQLYQKVLFPAAGPLVFAGLKMGFIYALIGAIAMEFVLTDTGLGFAVRYHYNNFDTPRMYGFVLLNLAIAIGVNWGLLRGERAVERGAM